MKRNKQVLITYAKGSYGNPRTPCCFGVLLVAFVLGGLLALTPVSVFACSGILDCAFGWSDREEVRQAAETERSRIEAQATAEQARIEGEAQAALRMAEAEVERVRQQRFVSEADRDIAIAQAQAQANQYAAMIKGLTDEKIAGIQANADTQIMALQSQAEIATAGILETGKTERYRIVGGWASTIIAFILVGLIVLYWMRRYAGSVTVLPQPRQAIGERTQLPWYSDSIEIVEVKNNATITRR